jgi:diaminohydroxyphosphoribosylaminopyrimidine deaminase/5-amino-6-(5-phosphoribosylamino)uracil reductase
MLREAGVRVDGPVLEGEAKQLIAPFIARTRLGRPYVTLKWAQTADGKVAGPGGRKMQISNERSSRIVHALRGRCDAILVGLRTVLADDPSLTVRGVETPHRTPARVVLDRDLDIPETSKLVTTAAQIPVWIYCHESATRAKKAKVATLRGYGVDVVTLPALEAGRLPVLEVLNDLGRRGVTNLLVEPGSALARALVDAEETDRIWVFRSPKRLGDSHAPSAPPISHPTIDTIELDGDVLTEYLNPKSLAFFAGVPSADFVLAEPAKFRSVSGPVGG